MSQDAPSLSTAETGERHHKPLIAAMGITGVGKSSFIRTATGRNEVIVGHELYSCTQDIAEYDFDVNGTIVTLVDTPGFNDSQLPDAAIFQRIATWLGHLCEQDRKLSGILYFQNIQESRVYGSSLRNLRMFRQLCGEDCYRNVILTTNRWSSPPTPQELRNETGYLRDMDLWGRMLERGSATARFDGQRATAISIIESLFTTKPCKLQVQKEIVDKGLGFDETSAGKVVNTELESLKAKAAEEIEELKQQLTEEKDRELKELLEEEREKVQENLNSATEQQRVLLEQSKQEQLDLADRMKKMLLDQPQRQQKLVAVEPNAPSANDLFSAVRDNNPRRVRALLDGGVYEDSRGPDGVTALYEAASRGFISIVRILLNVNANLYIKDADGNTALHAAVSNGHTGIAKTIILDLNYEVDIKNDLGQTPLHKACSCGYLSLAEALIIEGADVRARDKRGRTPLHYAAKNGQKGVARLLVWNGAKVTAKDADNRKPVYLARTNNHQHTVRFLRSKE